MGKSLIGVDDGHGRRTPETDATRSWSEQGEREWRHTYIVTASDFLFKVVMASESADNAGALNGQVFILHTEGGNVSLLSYSHCRCY